MTVTYSLAVANTRFCGFAKLLSRWRGSIYKILWKEFSLFCLGYALLSLTYRCLLDAEQRAVFEKVVLFVDTLTDMIPLSFVLGFYVSLVIGRWWAQYDAIPWPDRACLLIGSYVHGADERSRMIRRTLGRYLLLMQVLTFQAVSTAVKRRFPTTQHLVTAGIMTKDERSVYDKISFVYGKWWVPCQWFCSLLLRARKEGRIKDSVLLDALFKELMNYRNSCGTMLSYDWISVPLVYTQVVTLATYMYAGALVVGRQYLDPSKEYNKHKVDLYIPFFTIMQFLFYVGWLKVAEQIVNPYGEDDDDFELNWCVDRTLEVVYLIVDHLQTKHPKIRKDHFWEEMEPKLPQTKHSAKAVENPQLGSAFNLEVAEAEYLPMDTFLEQDTEENMYAGDSLRQRSLAGSSFLMRFLNRQSFGKKSSLAKEETVQKPTRTTSAANHEKSGFSTPIVSRSFVRKASPSSISFRPDSANLHRTKSGDQHEIAVELDNSFSLESGQKFPSPGQLEDTHSASEDKHEVDPGGSRLESYMPPIPEEPSRISLTSVEPNDREEVTTELEDFMKEANDVLKELNETITAEGHRQDCELKGYESCCSLGSGNSSDESSDEVGQNEVVMQNNVRDTINFTENTET